MIKIINRSFTLKSEIRSLRNRTKAETSSIQSIQLVALRRLNILWTSIISRNKFAYFKNKPVSDHIFENKLVMVLLRNVYLTFSFSLNILKLCTPLHSSTSGLKIIKRSREVIRGEETKIKKIIKTAETRDNILPVHNVLI